MQTENNPIAPRLLKSLQREADGRGCLSYADFIRIAALDPEEGYYSQPKERVGCSPETDFYTAESLGEVFGKLVHAASIELLGSIEAAKEHVFVEIGAEPGCWALDGVDHAFGETLILRLGDDLQIPEKAIVFANEWLDAYPFHRLRFDPNEGWQELGVTIENGRNLSETTLPSLTPPVHAIRDKLPAESSDGYVLDLPLDAANALAHIASQRWRGVFFCFDYGKSWEALSYATPSGTGRAYSSHQVKRTLLANPGKEDITCHLCWDFLVETLQKSGFQDIRVERQESFLMNRASSAIRKIIEKKELGPDPDAQTLMELLHPARMGDAFQVLSAIRT